MLLTRTVKRYALRPPEFMFAEAVAGTISVLRTFKAVTTSIRRGRDLLQWRQTAICRRRLPVCTENSSSGVVVVKPAKDGV